jgi:hypothetical protein
MCAGPRLAHMAKVMFLLALFSLVSTAIVSPVLTPPEPAVWKVRLEVPGLSGFNRLFRDDPPPFPAADRIPGADWKLIGISLAGQWQGRWTAEAHAGYILEQPLYREVLGLRGGRYVTLRDRRGAGGRGGVTILAPLGGVAYRGRGNNWVHGPADNGQFSIALTSALALDYTFFMSRRWGWTFRARIDGALVVHQAGPPIWRDPEGPVYRDGYRGHLGLGLDLGVAF